MARANSQWRGFESSPRVLVVFSGPHGYVSPTTYVVTPAAPTWNYAAVHVTGRVRVIDDPETTLDVIKATVAVAERRQQAAWQIKPSLEYAKRILPGLVAFTIDVDDVRSTFKLSQDKSPELQNRVISAFERSGSGSESELAALMTDVLRDRDDHAR
jgi:transcriptional regulator